MKKNYCSRTCLLLALLFITFSGLKAQTIDLFNGVDLKNWEFVTEGKVGNADNTASVQNGVIAIKGEPFGYLRTKEVYADYSLHVEWRWPKEATNSGIFLHVQPEDKIWPNAIECQLHHGDAGDFVLLGGSDLAEFVIAKGVERPKFPVVKKSHPSSELPVGEWNNAHIICKNGTITVFINGVLQNKGTKSLHKKGYIALQSEGKDIQFRNVRLTPLK